MITAVTPTDTDLQTARHARLFELIRQRNLSAGSETTQADADLPQPGLGDFVRAARASLLPQEQKALGISASFGR